MAHTETTTIRLVSLDDYLQAVSDRLEDRWSIGSGDYLDSCEDARLQAIRACLDGLTAEQAADAIGADWEPSDAELIAYNSCGTAWHDGCR